MSTETRFHTIEEYIKILDTKGDINEKYYTNYRRW